MSADSERATKCSKDTCLKFIWNVYNVYGLRMKARERARDGGRAHIFSILFGGTLFCFLHFRRCFPPVKREKLELLRSKIILILWKVNAEKKKAPTRAHTQRSEAMNQNNSNENVNKFVLQSSDMKRKRAKVCGDGEHGARHLAEEGGGEWLVDGWWRSALKWDPKNTYNYR